MNNKRILFWLKLFLILVLTGNISTTAQDGADAKSGGCGRSKNKTNVLNANISNTSANDLSARVWNLIEINGAKVESTKAFVEFIAAEKRFAGNAGCNRMFGKFETNGNKIKFSGIGTTKVFCSQQGVMKLESDFIKALEQTTHFEQTVETLDFYAGNILILKFSGAEKNTPGNQNSNIAGNENSNTVKLKDKKWVLTAAAGKLVPKLENMPFLVFDKEKASAGGNTSCNSFGGSYKIDGNKISFTEIIQTFIACENNRMNVEREFLGGLQNVNLFEIKNGKLNLYEGDKLLLSFDAREKN